MTVVFEAGSGDLTGPRRIARRLGGAAEPVFSLCTMLTNWEEYRECMASFRARGFDEARCEFIVIDNSRSNLADGYVALNEFLQAARAPHVILCHQDLLLLERGFDDLVARLAELTQADPHWGVCGNAGVGEDGTMVLCLLHPAGEDIQGGPFPAKVISLDENFLVARKEANLALSRDLHGFHHYAVDLCTVADVLGWNSYVIDFVLQHKSSGTMDDSYRLSGERIAAKYRRALRPRWAYLVTSRRFLLSGLRVHHQAWETRRRAVKMAKALGLRAFWRRRG